MSTNYGGPAPTPGAAEQSITFGQLYRPKVGAYAKKKPGDVLPSLQRSGREVIKTQRTRWSRNRMMYQGEQNIRIVGSTVRTLAPTEKLPPGRRRDIVNRLRSFTDGRVSMLASKKPPFAVIADGLDDSDVDAARVATRFVDAMWSEQYWDLDMVFRRLALAGEIDGVVFMQVIYDPTAGEKTTIGIDMATGMPITDRSMLETMRAADPSASSLWKSVPISQGEVRFRIVRCGSLSIDPSVRERWSDGKWIIESRLLHHSVIESEAGKTIKNMIYDSKLARGENLGSDPYAGYDYGQVNFEDTEGQEGTRSSKDFCIVHEVFVKPHGDWPRGAHIKWVDIAPDDPYILEEWDDELPYFPYTPRPDGGHLLRSKGIVDDLVPIQTRLNRTLSQLGEWLDRVARPPLVLAGGGLRAETPRVFNDDGYVITNHGYADPRFMTVPSEPNAVLTQHLQFLLDQMSEISMQSDATRGLAPSNTDSASGVQMLIQQNEQQMSGTAGELIRSMQWAVSRALSLVQDNYSIPRTIAMPGAYDSSELVAFIGQKIRGATHFRVTGSLLPKSQAAQQQMFMQMVQASQGKIDFTPHLASILEGNMEEIVSKEQAQAKDQRKENQLMVRMQQIPKQQLDSLWKDYTDLLQKYTQTLQQVEPKANELGITPEAMLQAQGIDLPTPTNVGLAVPPVHEFNRDGNHIEELDSFCTSDAYSNLHPIIKAVLDEHRKLHVAKLARTLSAGPPQPMGDTGGASPTRQNTGSQNGGTNQPSPPQVKIT